MSGPFARIIANFLVMGSTVLVRAAAQAWRQAILNGTKAGVTAEGAAKAAAGAKSKLSLQEAQMILNVEANAPWEEVVKKYNHLMAANSQHGSFYLQSKVHRSMERIGEEMGKDTSGMGGAGPAGGAEGEAGGSTPPEGVAPGSGPGSVNATAAASAHGSDARRWGGFAASGVGTDGRH